MSKSEGPNTEVHSQVERLLLQGAEVHLLNTTIIPPGADGLWRVCEVPVEYVNRILFWLGSSGGWGYLHSHTSLASELLEQKIEVDRRPWRGEGIGVAIQLNGRAPEGKILSREEMEQIGYTLRLVFRAQAPATSTTGAGLDAVRGLIVALRPILELHRHGAQGVHDSLFDDFERFAATIGA